MYKSTLYSGSHEREGKVSGPSRPGWCGITAHVCVEEEETEACNHAVVAEEAIGLFHCLPVVEHNQNSKPYLVLKLHLLVLKYRIVVI